MRKNIRTGVSIAATLTLLVPLWASAKPPKPPPGGDSVAPAAVSDLQESAVTEFSVTLQWTAAPDDGTDCGSGPASQYDIRYSTSPIVDQADWDDAWIPYGLPPVPGDPCVPLAESKIVYNLIPDTIYYFRMKVADEVPNWSDLSNEAIVTTLPGIWSWEQIDQQNTGQDVAFAPDGTPSLAYPNSDGDIVFADYNGATWDFEVVGPGNGCDVAYDGAGTPIIAHKLKAGGRRKDPPTDLRVYRWNGSTWDLETVDTNIGHNSGVPIAVDSAGNPAIAYQKGADVMLARWNDVSSSWDTEIVETIVGNPGIPGCVSVAFDPDDGAPTLSYCAYLGYTDVQDLRFARWDGSAWAVETIVAGTNLIAGTPNGLAYDPTTGHPSIVYHLSPPSIPWSTHLATWDGATWIIDLIDEEDATGMPWKDSSLAYDDAGVLWVAYTRSPQDCGGTEEMNEVRVAYLDTGAWVFETPLRMRPCGWGSPQMHIDPSGIPVISATGQRYGRRE